MKHDMYELPESLYEFAQIYDFHGVIEDLAAMAEDEDWNYHNTTGASNLPILENYVRNTYIRLSREKKVAYSTDSKFCCFDTGLLSRIQHEPIYMQFCENTNPSVDCYWYFSNFLEKANMTYGDMLNYQKWHFIGKIQLSWCLIHGKSLL